jgi:hypothetical protein
MAVHRAYEADGGVSSVKSRDHSGCAAARAKTSVKPPNRPHVT